MGSETANSAPKASAHTLGAYLCPTRGQCEKCEGHPSPPCGHCHLQELAHVWLFVSFGASANVPPGDPVGCETASYPEEQQGHESHKPPMKMQRVCASGDHGERVEGPAHVEMGYRLFFVFHQRFPCVDWFVQALPTLRLEYPYALQKERYTMVAPWRSVAKAEPVRIIAPDGTERCTVPAYYAGNIFIVDDMRADMEPGDELRRLLPNGKDDVFRIDDPRLYDTGHLPAHYQVKVSRKGTFPHNTGGHYISVSGPNSRVNLNSTDNSTNIVNSGDIFGDMRQVINGRVIDPAQRQEILRAIDEAEEVRGTPSFLAAYQRVVSVAADHIGLLAPFLPALAAMI